MVPLNNIEGKIKQVWKERKKKNEVRKNFFEIPKLIKYLKYYAFFIFDSKIDATHACIKYDHLS